LPAVDLAKLIDTSYVMACKFLHLLTIEYSSEFFQEIMR
jgi:hypothetical protein